MNYPLEGGKGMWIFQNSIQDVMLDFMHWSCCLLLFQLLLYETESDICEADFEFLIFCLILPSAFIKCNSYHGGLVCSMSYSIIDNNRTTNNMLLLIQNHNYNVVKDNYNVVKDISISQVTLSQFYQGLAFH